MQPIKNSKVRGITFLGLLIISGTIALMSCKYSQISTRSGNDWGTLRNESADTLIRDTVLHFPAQPKNGYNFSYFIYLPKGLHLSQALTLIVETTNTGANDSIQHHEKGARYAASKSSVGNFVSRKLKLPLLVPVFPRSKTNWQYYTHALDRDALLCKDWGLKRLDLQLLRMIENAKKGLGSRKIFLKEKFFITGFSASGTFANRFVLLHPEKVQATASGGINAIAILPVANYMGKTLNYPLGIGDVQKITGINVNLEAFRNVPQLLFMGQNDDNDAVAYEDAYSGAEKALVYEMMGEKLIPTRWSFIQKIYQENKVCADFRTYPNIGHGTDLKINTDIVNFFKKHL